MSNVVYTAPAARNGFAVTALVLSLFALIGAFIPLVNIASIVFALAASIFAIAGIVRARKVHVGFALALAALLISIITVVTAILVNVAAAATVTAVDQGITEMNSDPAFLEYDLEAKSDELYPNGIYGDVDQNGKLDKSETYSTKGSEGWLKQEDLDGNGKVSHYEAEKSWYDLSNTDF